MSLLFLAILQAVGIPASQEAAADSSFSYELPSQPKHLALIDFPQLQACSRVEVRTGELYLPTPSGGLSRTFSGQSILWTVADFDHDGRDDFLSLVDGQRLERLVFDPQPPALRWEVVLDVLGGRNGVPRGLWPASFVRDIDGDGRLDLLVPVGEKVELWFGDAQAANGFKRGPLLRVASSLALEVPILNRNSLLGRLERRMTIPTIEMNDISGDGLPDLLVSGEEMVSQYISTVDGLPGEPTATVDLSKFQNQVPELKFDPGNIAGLTRYVVQEEWMDLNGDGALDLIVFAGGTIIIYMGGEDGLDLRRPRDQMPTRGNVLLVTAMQIDADEVPDLVLLRIEDISLARIFSFLFVDVSNEFDILAYQGKGDGRFQHRPMKQSKSVEIKLPSLLELAADKDDAEEVRHSVYRTADFDGDGVATDLVAMNPFGGLKVWLGVVADESEMSGLANQVLKRALAAPKKVELDIQTIGKWVMGRTSLLPSLADGRAPDAIRKAPEPRRERPQTMAVNDFDGDGCDELMVLRNLQNQKGLHGIVWDPFEKNQ